MSNLYPREAWRVAVVLIAILLLLTFYLCQQTILYLIGQWNQLDGGDYGHGYLVLLISAYLMFYNRQRLMVLTPCPEYRAILAVLGASMLWAVVVLVDVEMMQTVALLLLVLSMMWALLGTRVTQILVFPVLYISFSIPIWFPLTPLLQDLTADIVFWLIRVMEIPALRIENTIVLPSGKLSVSEACAGLRYLMAALSLGTLYAYLNYEAFLSRLTVVLVAAGIAVLANILRVFIVVYLAYTTDMQHPFVQDHVFLGWYLFGGLVVLLLVVDSLLHRNSLHEPDGALDKAGYKPVPCANGKLQFVAIALVTAMFISAGPAIVFSINSQSQFVSYPVQAKSLLATEKWSYMDADEDGWTPQYRGAVNHKMVFHDKYNNKIHLYLGVYPTQRQGEELINDLNRISDNKIWHTRYQRPKQYTVGGDQVLEQILEKNDGTRRLVWYWYHVAGQDTANKYQAKALQVLGLLNGKRQASIVAVAAKLGDDSEYTREILSRFAAEMGPSLSRVIDDDQ